MYNLKKISLILGFSFSLSLSFAQDFAMNVGGFVDTFHSAQVFKPKADLSENDSSNGDRKFLDSRTRVRMELDAYQDDCDVFISADAAYDGACDSRTGFELKEAYIDWTGNLFGIRAGRQIIVWGKADGVQITDIVCPLDNTTLAGADITDQRLPVNALSFNVHTQIISVDAMIIPVFTPEKLPWKDDNPLHEIMFPSISSGSKMEWTEPENPEITLENAEAALRISAWLPFADIAASFFTGNDDNAAFTMTQKSGTVEVTGEYHRIYMAGLESAIPLGDFIIRTEGAFFMDKYFQGKEWNSIGSSFVCSPQKSNQVRALAGFDWNPSGWSITAQYIEDIILDYDEDKISRNRREPLLTLSLEKSFIHDILTLSFSSVMDINDLDCVLCPSIEYDVNDYIKLKGGADFYTEGQDKNSNYGKMKDASCAYVKMVYNY